ncbi:MAG: hypothetical protein ACHQK9_07190 [Reyranellales bacterium]
MSLWTKRAGFPIVWAALTGRPGGPDVEPEQIEWLRENSNYLTPKLGLTSGDFWTAVALYFRNLILNWLVIVPVLAAAVIGLKLYAAASAMFWRDMMGHWPTLALVGFGAVALFVSLRSSARHRPSRGGEAITQVQFFWHDLLWATVAAAALSLCVVSDAAADGVKAALRLIETTPRLAIMIAGGVCFAAVYAASWLFPWPRRHDLRDFLLWTAAGVAYGAAVGLGAYLCVNLDNHKADIFRLDVPSTRLLVVLILGVPWALFSQLFAEMVFVGLSSYEPDSDADREWLGRKSGFIIAVALAWPIVMVLVLVGSDVAPNLWQTVKTSLGPLGGVTGLVTLLVGKSSYSPHSAGAQGFKALSMNVVLGIAALLFAGALLVLMSALVDKVLLGGSLLHTALMADHSNVAVTIPGTRLQGWVELVVGLAGVLGVGYVASHTVNVNRFSLHSLYRNRLIRAYLGASTHPRNPDPFTKFDLADNGYMKGLWPAKIEGGWQPFHVINMALNIVSTKRLAWQERKAESFTTSPLHSGAGCLAFRTSDKYGGANGITLGTAMAISGAAASPNMGYHSSTGVAFLMALFNVRLGWWLGNPGKEGEQTYTHEGPYKAVRPLLNETFGLTTDTKPYVYLSDGGHFENLGLYEMVRRRCRFIVVSDAGCDPDFVFEDLGNAVRKIAIDLGIEIRFHGLEKLKKRPSGKGKDSGDVGANAPYHAIGVIDYKTADGWTSENGIVLYIKAGYHGVESAGIRSYALAHADFPHETTADQWFTESQLESYRALGFEIMDSILTSGAAGLDREKTPTLEAILEALVSRPPRPVG